QQLHRWGRGLGRGGFFFCAFASFKAVSCRKRQSDFVRLPAPELLSLCVPKEKVAKEKWHPDGAPSGHPALQVRGRVTGFFDGTSVYRRKTGRHPCRPSCGLSSTRPPRHRGPG